MIVHGITGNLKKRDMGIFSTYTQRLKQLGFSLDTLEDVQPAIFRWMVLLLTGYGRPSLGFIRSTLQIVLSLGADINARWRGSPLLNLFWGCKLIDTDNEESNTTLMTDIAIALLENGVDPVALSDDGVSIFNVAEHTGWNSELAQALQRTGYNLGKVICKTLLAQLIFFRPGISLAKSTAVDRSQIKPPSTAGLVSRRAVAGDRLEE